MLRLNHYVLALVVWLSFFFNIERLDLDIGNPDVFDISFTIYIAIIGISVLSFLLPQWKRVPLWSVEVLAAIVFLLATVLDDRPAWGGGYTYLSLFELCSTLVTAWLTFTIGQLTADFLGTARNLIFSDTAGRVFDGKDAESLAKLQMQSSRRTNRPLSVVLIDVNIEDADIALQATAKEIQHLLVKRYRLNSLTRLLSRTIRRTDFVFDQSKDGRLILIAPEMQKEQTASLIDRLNRNAQQRLGVSVRCGIASFPQQGATFEELVYQAEQDLLPDVRERRVEEPSDRHESITEQFSGAD